MALAIRADDINRRPINDRRGRGPGSALGHISPIAILFFVRVNPENLACPLVEAMQSLSDRGLRHFDVENKSSALGYHWTRPPTAHRPSPLHLQAFKGKRLQDSCFLPTSIPIRAAKLRPIDALDRRCLQEVGGYGAEK